MDDSPFNLRRFMGTLPRVKTPMPGDPRRLEFWPPNELGDRQFPRPSGLPMGEPGIQTIAPDVSENDIAADVVSHWAVQQDPELARLYGQFSNTFQAPAMQPRLNQDYQWSQQNEGERRSFQDWLTATRIPDYMRGYMFNQWPLQARQGAFTPQQKQILDNMAVAIGGGAGR
jgi:hypothetical protein